MLCSPLRKIGVAPLLASRGPASKPLGLGNCISGVGGLDRVLSKELGAHRDWRFDSRVDEFVRFEIEQLGHCWVALENDPDVLADHLGQIGLTNEDRLKRLRVLPCLRCQREVTQRHLHMFQCRLGG